MLRRFVGGFAVVAALGSSLLFARQGTVVTLDGKSYTGDVTEQGDNVTIAKVPGLPGPVGLRKANVQSIMYPDQVEKDVHAALLKLPPNDARSRVELANVAFKSGAYTAARDALDQALAIDPNNREATDLMARVRPHLPSATVTTTQPATNPATASGTPSATQPVSTTGNPTGTPTTPGKGGEPWVFKREATPVEINHIRQVEWHQEERGGGNPKIMIDPETKRTFLAGYVDATPGEFNKMTPAQQADLILTKGKPELRDGVHINSDPKVVAEFKKPLVEHTILIGCAAANCHGGDKAGHLKLIAPASNDAATYTDFLVLLKYSKTMKRATDDPKEKPTERFLVDRQFPDQSLLLQYMLPPNVADTPHPKAEGFKPVARTKADPKFQAVYNWIRSLNPVAPEYGVDLTKDPEPPVKPGK